ncbi:Cyclin-dependent kinase 9 [Araneus ventricosus]|uniref:Cyclin-dependent kinase 9 n=1 Tax=Araneus ventricosus TaxID=182803 RepID=A0A4Y2IR24_ARAVE|nr:Cyclin-dependent kinase 9 [Araneus ventricosus]
MALNNKENKGIKRENEQVNDAKLLKKPCFYEEKKESHFAKLVAKLSDANFPYCNKLEDYDDLFKIGQGTFGEVFKARHRTSKKVVALKRVLTENTNEGFPITALREIKILQQLKNKNVVSLIDTCRSKKSTSGSCHVVSFYLVFEFCEHDLAGLISNRSLKFTLAEIKGVMKQLFNGLFFIHSSNILHRDIKAANILITKDGVLKIADFGLARPYSENKCAEKPNKFTNKVITLWYRPPELLLGERNYGPPIDLWGSGCVMAEMWTRTPIMQGDSEQHQLALITRLCGSITPETFPGCEKLDLWNNLNLPTDSKRRVKEKLVDCVKDPPALDLLDKLLTIDPGRRINADDALLHDFFWADPLPVDLKRVLEPLKKSMFEFSSRNGGDVRNHGAGPSRAHPTADDGYHERVF